MSSSTPPPRSPYKVEPGAIEFMPKLYFMPYRAAKPTTMSPRKAELIRRDQMRAYAERMAAQHSRLVKAFLSAPRKKLTRWQRFLDFFDL